MSIVNSAQASLTRWMRPSVAKSWMAQITRSSRRRRILYGEEAGEAAFRTLLDRDWVTINFGRSPGRFSR